MADIYINADSGNDSTGTGASGAPYLTVEKGITESSSGDSVILQKADNVYDMVTDNLNHSLTIKADTDGTDAMGNQLYADVILDGGNSAVKWEIRSSGVTMNYENLTFQNIIPNAATDPIFTVYSVTNQTSTSNFTNCDFRDIQISSGTTSGNGLRGGLVGNDTIVATNFSVTFDGCNLSGIKGYEPFESGITGLFSFDSTTNSTFTLNNSVVRLDGLAANDEDVAYLFAWRNGGTSTLTVKNTIIIGNESTAWNRGTSLATEDVDYVALPNITGKPSITNEITDDPLVVDSVNGVMFLRPGSPCFSSGVSV